MIALGRTSLLFHRGKRILREEGLLSFFKQVVSFLAHSFFSYETHHVYENTLEHLEEANFVPKVQNLTLSIISTQQELDRLLANGYDFSFYTNIKEDREWLDEDAILFCAFIGKNLAHKSWVALSEKSKIDVTGYPLNMDYQTQVRIGEIATNPKYRGLGILTYVLFRQFQYLKKSSKSKAIFIIRKDNVAQHKAQAKLGSRIYGEGVHLRLLLTGHIWRFKARKNTFL